VLVVEHEVRLAALPEQHLPRPLCRRIVPPSAQCLPCNEGIPLLDLRDVAVSMPHAVDARRVDGRSTYRAPRWRRVLALCVALWTAVALSLGGDAAASPDHEPHAAHAQASHRVHHGGTEDCHPSSPRHSPAPSRHAPARSPHAHHGTCLDCCCASATPHLPASADAPFAASAPRIAVAPTHTEAPCVPGDFLHPFPNGPPSLRA